MKVFKYQLAIARNQTLRLPAGSRILSAGLDPGDQLCIWALVREDAPPEPWNILIAGTGHALMGDDTDGFIGTVRDGELMLHLFGSKQ